MVSVIAQIIELASGDAEKAARLIVAMFASHIKAAEESGRAHATLTQRERWAAQKQAQREALRNNHARDMSADIRGRKIDISLNTEPKEKVSIPCPRTSTDASETFSSFWALYPVKRGKADALRAWKKAAPKVGGETALLGLITKALAWQVKSRQFTEKNGTFIPHPATYINRGSWDDEPDAPPRPAPKPEQYNPYRKVG